MGMDFVALLGRQLKDDVVLEVLEFYDLQVVYEFDRTHENMDDIYWASASSDGFQLRFNQDQVLDTVFLYVMASEGITPIALNEVEVPLFHTFDEAKQDFESSGAFLKESPGEKWWVKGSFGTHTRHYEYRDNALFRLTLSLIAG
jgi:hypothetical protein